MRSAAVALGLAMVASLAASAPASAQEAEGRISIEAFTLTGTQFGTPTGNPTLVETDPLESPVMAGDTFTTSSIECSSGPAPFNDVGLDFSPDFPGSRIPPRSDRSSRAW